MLVVQVLVFFLLRLVEIVLMLMLLENLVLEIVVYFVDIFVDVVGDFYDYIILCEGVGADELC